MYQKFGNFWNTLCTSKERDHKFYWVNGARMYSDDLDMAESVKRNIWKSQPAKLFETYASNEMNIIDACQKTGFALRLDDWNTFIGIIIISLFNKGKSQRDYWSSDQFLFCEIVFSAVPTLF